MTHPEAAVDALAHIGHCATCRRVIDMRETDEGGDGFGAENEDGTWSCSSGCQSEHYLNAANAKLAMAREALTRTADQALGDEIPPGYGPDMSDGAEFHRGYDAAIQAARAALAEIERMK